MAQASAGQMEEVRLSSGSGAQHQPGRARTELTRETLAAGAHDHEDNWSEAVLRTAQGGGIICRERAVGSLASQRVLYAAHRVLRLALGLIGSTFRLELGVAQHAPDPLLEGALGSLG